MEPSASLVAPASPESVSDRDSPPPRPRTQTIFVSPQPDAPLELERDGGQQYTVMASRSARTEGVQRTDERLRTFGSPPPRQPPRRSARPSDTAKPMLHLFCASEGCDGPLICSRALAVKSHHGLKPNWEPTPDRPTRLVDVFTSDSPPSNWTALLDELTRVQPDLTVSAGTGAVRDGCACLRVGLGCRACGTRLGWMIVSPCSLCLRECSSGHCYLFDGSLVSRPRCASDTSAVRPDVAEPGADDLPAPLPLLWSRGICPTPAEDYERGFVGDPVDFLRLEAYASSEPSKPSLRTRLPYWLLAAKSASDAPPDADVELPPLRRWSAVARRTRQDALPPLEPPTEASLQRAASIRGPSTSALRDTAAAVAPIAFAARLAPSRTIDLSSPNAEDVHVLETLGYGSLSAAQARPPKRKSELIGR